MALAAITLAARPATSQRTYGTYRLEVLAALANGLLLFGVAGYVLFEPTGASANPQRCRAHRSWSWLSSGWS